MGEKSESGSAWHIREALEIGKTSWSAQSAWLLYAMVLTGMLAFLFGILSRQERVWQVFLVNVLFWSGLSASGVVISATWNIVGSRWGVAFKRIAEGMAAFLPISFLLFVILLLSAGEWLPWLSAPSSHRTAWLNLPLFLARNVAGLVTLYGMSILYVYLSLRPDVGVAIERRLADSAGCRGLLVRGWKGSEIEIARRDRVLRWYSVALVIVYCLVLSLLGFDFVMSLDSRWYSTLFGIYFFVGSLYAGFAAVGVLASHYLLKGSLKGIVSPAHMHDQGKLTFAFCMLTGYMLFTQFLVLWYGNLPEEAGFLAHRIKDAPWSGLAPVAALMAVIIPFCILLSRSLKKTALGLLSMGLFILAGMWLERFILVVPSLWHGADLPLSWMELAITGGFLGAALLCYRAFARSFPMVAITDRLFSETLDFHVH
jgi:hypothetical protein